MGGAPVVGELGTLLADAGSVYGDCVGVAGELAGGVGAGLVLVADGVTVRDGPAVGAWLTDGDGELLGRFAGGGGTAVRAGAGREVFCWTGPLVRRAGDGAAGLGRTSR